jgi:8-oxo-dGTP pyrophosphatase MutT (NUDIX family)
MREAETPRPVVTVATVAVRDGLFLFVEEETRAGLRLNQPAGHLEAGESLVAAARRETLEETGYRVEPSALVGIYRWQATETGATFVRFAFAADVVGHDPHRPLDRGIVRALWLAPGEIATSGSRHRSPLVQRCVDDYVAGCRLPLSAVTEL